MDTDRHSYKVALCFCNLIIIFILTQNSSNSDFIINNILYLSFITLIPKLQLY